MGPQYLDRLLSSIASQEDVEYRVFISDSDDTGAIWRVIDKHSPKLNPIYTKNLTRIGAAENINNVIELAERWLENEQGPQHFKLMCMDDLLMSPKALHYFYAHLNTFAGWTISNSFIINSRDAEKRIVKSVFDPEVFDRNIVGMPSCIGWTHITGIRFDTDLKTFCDTEFYFQLHKYYGMPTHIQKPVIGQRYHPQSQSRNQPATHERDAAIIKQRYGKKQK